MTVKLVVLRSGQNVVADVQEMLVEERVIGFYLNNPMVVSIVNQKATEQIGDRIQNTFDVSFYPWIPLTNDTKIPISTDCVVTIVEPLDQLLSLYKEKVALLGYENRKNDSSAESSNTDSAD